MKKSRTIWNRCCRAAVLCLLLSVLCAPVHAQIAVDYTETWDTAGDVAGWYGGWRMASLSNPGGYMDIRFRRQTAPESTMLIARTDVTNMVVSKVTFTFTAVEQQPSALRLYIEGMSGKSWYVNLDPPAAGETATYEIPVDYSAGWAIGPAGTEQQFLSDMKNQKWVGLYVRRSASMDEHHFGIDDFRVEGYTGAVDTDGDGMPDTWEIANGYDPNTATDAEADSDGDGMSNYAEYRAGTNPYDAESQFTLDIGETEDEEEVAGVVIKWGSVPFRTYVILRATNLMSGFSPMYMGIPATPPVNVFVDNMATGAGPYFYKVQVED